MEWNNDETYIRKWIENLKQFNRTPGAGITRQLFTPEDMAARVYIKNEMEHLGLEITEDAMGNIFAVSEGTEPKLAPIWSGSHLDTVYQGGAFDGISGVVCAMEAIRMIGEAGISHKRNLTAVVFSGEEPARFGIGCIGSRAMIGAMTVQDTKKYCDQDGISLWEAMKNVGLDPEKIPEAIKRPGDVYATVELHIEQNVHLDRENIPIGIVTSICAPSNLIVEVEGRSAHAGGMSMEERRDAFAAACEMSLEIERLGKTESTSDFTTATVGSVKVEPNQSNIIPGKVTFTVDVRDAAKESKDRIMGLIRKAIERIAQARQVNVTIGEQNNDTPMPCDPHIMELIQKYCEDSKIPFKKMVSGPFHDSLHTGEFAPAGMIFVPSRNGLSHCPEEWTSYEDLVRGSRILASVLADLAEE